MSAIFFYFFLLKLEFGRCTLVGKTFNILWEYNIWSGIFQFVFIRAEGRTKGQYSHENWSKVRPSLEAGSYNHQLVNELQTRLVLDSIVFNDYVLSIGITDRNRRFQQASLFQASGMVYRFPCFFLRELIKDFDAKLNRIRRKQKKNLG